MKDSTAKTSDNLLCTQGIWYSTQKPKCVGPSNWDNPEIMISAGAQIEDYVPTLSVGKICEELSLWYGNVNTTWIFVQLSQTFSLQRYNTSLVWALHNWPEVYSYSIHFVGKGTVTSGGCIGEIRKLKSQGSAVAWTLLNKSSYPYIILYSLFLKNSFKEGPNIM